MMPKPEGATSIGTRASVGPPWPPLREGGVTVTKREKVRENKCRRGAERQGLRLKKCRRRDPRALGYGNYWLVSSVGDTVIGGQHGTTLAIVEQYLWRER